MATKQKQFEKLGQAWAQRDLSAIEKLLAAGMRADEFPYNARGDSVLMAAIRAGHLDVVQLLVEQGGASYAYRNPAGDTPLTYAARYDRGEIIDYLAARGAPIRNVPFAELPRADKDARLFEALSDWTNSELPARLTRMIAGGADPNARRDGRTPLLVLTGQSASGTELYQALVDGGADPSLADEAGTTPLHELAEGGSEIDEAKLLLAAGVSIEVRDGEGRTPLHRAAASDYWGALEFVKFLVGAGANARALDAAGRAPADLASGDSKKWLIDQTRADVCG